MSEVAQRQRVGQLGLQIMSRGAMRDTYRFAAIEHDGALIVASAPFTSRSVLSRGDNQTHQMLQSLVAELAVLGWQAIPTGPKWYDHRVYYVGATQAPAASAAGMAMPMGAPIPIITQVQAPRRGLSPGVMWFWSVVIILLLFVVCVVLVYSTEIRMTATG